MTKGSKIRRFGNGSRVSQDAPADVEFLRIPREALDDTDRTFVVSYGYDLAPLTASIQTLGLLNPLLVRQRPDGRYQIIAGWQRHLVLQDLRWQELPVFCTPPETPTRWCLLASLQDNALGRGFNPWEAATMIQRLLEFFPAAQVIQEHLPLLGLPPSPALLAKYQALLHLEEPWHQLVAHLRLSVEAGARLSTWPAADRRALLPWWRLLPLSHSKQLALLEHLTTLSRRTGLPVAQWLAKPELAGILADPALTAADKDRRLWDTLRRWCWPRLSRARDAAQANLQALGLQDHPHLRLQPSPAFEDPTWRLEVRFRDPQHLADLLRQLQELVDRPELAALCRL